MNALVTGATGIIGAHLVRELVSAGHEVAALVRPASDRRCLSGVRLTFFEGNVLDPASLQRCLEGRDVVFHAAAIFAYWGNSRDTLDRVAVEGTRNVLDAAAVARVQRVVLTSSSVVFGSSTRAAVRTESDSFEDPDAAPYVLSKVHQDRAAFAAAQALGLHLVAACPTLAVGAHDYRLSTSNAMLTTYLNDPWRSTFPGGGNIAWARDIARGHILLAERGQAGERYLLGGENLTWLQLHQALSEVCSLGGPWLSLNHTASYLAAAAAQFFSQVSGRSPAVTLDQARMVGRFYWYDHRKAAALGYRPVPARAAILEALRWLVTTCHINRFVRAGIRLPDPDAPTSGPMGGGGQ
jgi:dihydroflavonol-4-reductase